MKVTAWGYRCQSRNPPMSKKLNIFPGTGFFRRNSAAAKENLCSVIPIPYCSWEKEKESIVPPNAVSAVTSTTTRATCRPENRVGGTGTFFFSAGLDFFLRSLPFPDEGFPFGCAFGANHSAVRATNPVRCREIPGE